MTKAQWDKAARENRVFKTKAYRTKAQADAAKRAATRIGTSLRPGYIAESVPTGITRKEQVTETVIIEKTETLGKAKLFTRSIGLNGSGLVVGLKGLEARHAVVLGVRFEVRFPLFTGHSRWVVATARKLSAGDKPVASVAQLVGAKIFNMANQIDQFVALPDVNGTIVTAGSTEAPVLDIDLRHIVFSLERTCEAELDITWRFHVTVRLDKDSEGAKYDL